MKVETPNWYSTMMQFRWTAKNLMLSFDVPRAVAVQIQHQFPSFSVACSIASAHRELTSQIGH
ncbi:hypothetical protein [Acidovorax sp.]|uniref:hypothetical protein n=1 Tax=Acidovorax sp. TaxID=1872122 RepID=UPI00391F9CAB